MRPAALTPALLLTLAATTTSLAQSLDIIYQSGDLAPDGNGTFSTVNLGASLNENGHVALTALYNGAAGGSSDDFAILLYDGSSLSTVTREGDPAPDANGLLGDPNLFAFTDAGELSFISATTGSAGGAADRNIIAHWNGSTVSVLVRKGDAVPGGGPTHNTLFPLFNSGAHAVWVDNVLGATPADDARLFRASTGGVTEIAREGDAPPEGNGVFSDPFFGDPFAGFVPPVVDRNGRVAFLGALDNTAGGFGIDAQGIYLSEPGQPLATIARQGDPAPGGVGDYLEIFPGVLAGTTHFIYNTSLSNSPGGSADDNAMFRFDGSTHTLLAQEGDPSTDANGTYQFFSAPDVNDAGVAIANIALQNTVGGFNDDRMCARVDGTTTTIVARGGQPAPDGNGDFREFAYLNINNSNQVLIDAVLRNTAGSSSDNSALYLHDPTDGFTKITRKGDAFLGSIVNQYVALGFNDDAQVLFWFQLADSTAGLALWSPSAPAMCPQDLDADDDVDVFDFNIFAPAFGTSLGDPGFLPAADFNDDDTIDVFDFNIFAPQFGCGI